jgi:L-ascorbate metabolism protein UlaG (beta-lactamase superfamily)
MGASDAARAAHFVETSIVVGVHYNTFPPIEIVKADALETFEKSGVTLLLPDIGGTIEV